MHLVQFSQGFPRLALSYLLGMLDGSIQGAEEGTAFLHDTMEMHLMKKVALCIAEILGTKPGQSRQAGILRKAPEEKQCWNTRILFFNTTTILFSNTTVPAAQKALLALLLDYCLLYRSEHAEQEPNFSRTELD